MDRSFKNILNQINFNFDFWQTINFYNMNLFHIITRCVIQATVKEELSPDFQTAEFVEKHGFVDKVVKRKDLTNEVGKLLEILLKKNSEVNSGLSNETSTYIEQTTKTAS